MATPLEQCGEYVDPIAQLHQQIQLAPDGSGEFLGFIEGNGWKVVGDPDYFKIKAINRGRRIFTKSYSPLTLDYSSRVYAALQALSEHQFSQPILPPLALCEGTLVFIAGTVKRRVVYSQVFHEVEQEIIEAVLRSHRLEPLWQVMKVDVVDVDKHEYIVDPLSDDANTIFEFIKSTE